MDYPIFSNFWQEEAQDDNPFVAKSCYCYGYDVYEDILANADSHAYWLMLFKKGKRPVDREIKLFDKLAILLANPGPREPMVHAAMCSSISGTNAAAVLTSSLAVGNGLLGGAREVPTIMDQFKCWQAQGIPQKIEIPEQEHADVWLPFEHVPGFDPNGNLTPRPIISALEVMTDIEIDGQVNWLKRNRAELEEKVGYPLSITAVAAAAMSDLGLENDYAEMVFLMLRMPGVIAHANEQKEFGFKKFPFYQDALELMDDPGSVTEESA